MLLPSWSRTEAIERLREEWQARGAVRVEPAFPEARAVDFMRALRGTTHVAEQRVDPVSGLQRWRYGWEPGSDCVDHPLCELGRGLWGDVRAWVAALTGRALVAPPESTLVCDEARKASFVDPWDEAAPGSAVAMRVHLCTAPWPQTWGGHLERLERADGPVVDRWAPAWNALDLFDLGAGRPTWRRVPMIDRHVQGFVVAAVLAVRDPGLTGK